MGRQGRGGRAGESAEGRGRGGGQHGGGDGGGVLLLLLSASLHLALPAASGLGSSSLPCCLRVRILLLALLPQGWEPPPCPAASGFKPFPPTIPAVPDLSPPLLPASLPAASESLMSQACTQSCLLHQSPSPALNPASCVRVSHLLSLLPACQCPCTHSCLHVSVPALTPACLPACLPRVKTGARVSLPSLPWEQSARAATMACCPT